MATMNEAVELELRDGVGIIWVDSPPVNAFGRAVRDGIHAALLATRDDAAVSALVLACKGRTFIAGADIKEFGGKMEGILLPDLLKLLDASEKPIVAAIHGTAFGGGLEGALCCNARVAASSAKFGLPEVKLGILPGAGGTQRLPRALGVEQALEMMVSGDPIGTEQALAGGLIDEVADEATFVERAVQFARDLASKKRPLRRVRDTDEKLEAVRKDPEFFTRYRKKIAARTRGFDAPEAIVKCVEAAVREPFDDGIKSERKQFFGLMGSAQARAQQYYFFAEREAAKVPDVPSTTQKREIRKVGIIGAGTMGGGIAMCFANIGIPVTLVEVKQEALERGLGTVRKNYERSIKSGKLTPQALEQRMALITGNMALESLRGCDLVIEAVFEDMGVKQEIFGKLDTICKPGAILASNTSALDINEIAACTKRPADVIGLHFFSPANVMKLLEVVRGKATAPEVIATSMALGKQLKKVPVLVGVCRGFVGNRMLFARRAQADKLILEGATPWDVDRVLYDFGFPMGPFAMSDLAGLDIGWDPKKSREGVRDRLCEMGRRGQKTNAGYYNYDPQTRAATPEPKVIELIEGLAREKGIERRAISDQEIAERCLYSMINEGARILEEGIAIRPSDIDVVWVNGYGWPVYRGGPMFHADSVSLKVVLQTLERFQAQDKDDFWKPSALLKKLADEDKGFLTPARKS